MPATASIARSRSLPLRFSRSNRATRRHPPGRRLVREPLEDRCLLAGAGFAEWAILGAYDDAPETQWFGDMDLQETGSSGTSTYYSGHIDWDTPSHGKGPHGREMVAGVLDAGTGHLHLAGSPDGTSSGTQFSRIYDAQLRPDEIELVDGVWTDGSLTGSWHAALCDGIRSDFDDRTDEVADPTGWHTTDTSDGVATWSPTGGDPGAYAHFNDYVTGADVHAVAPSAYLGSWLRPAADVPVMLSIDFRLDTSITELAYGPTFFIYGPDGAAYLEYVEPLDNGDPIIGQWETLIFPIVPSSDWTIAGDWNAVLNDVTRLEVWAEYITGAEENGLDNVHLLLPKQPTGNISGHIWSDSNGNGAHEGSETGLAGRTVYLDANGNGSLDSGEAARSTGADGAYAFNNVTAGVYTVRQVGVDGWTQTSPSGPRGRGMDQYAASVVSYSSQYGDTDWSADQTRGWPDVGTYGDSALAWAPLPENGSTETLTLGFDTPVLAIGATIRETLGNGFVTEVDALDQNGVFHPVWSGIDPSQPGSPVDFDVTWPATSYQVIGLRITIDTDHDQSAWEEIDSVQLHGLLDPPEGPWADAAIQTSANDASAPAALAGPDVPAYGDSPLAWKPSSMDGGAATLTLGYETPLFAYGAVIRQTCGNGFVTQVDALDLAGNWHTVWSGTDPTQGGQPADFNVTWPTPQYAVRGLRITVDTNHAPGEYEEIDAVRLFGTIDLSGGQNAASVIDFSHQRSSTNHSAGQATGDFDVYVYGDKSAAWAPESKTGTTEFLTLGFATPVYATGAMIRETCGNGFVTGIDVLDVEGNYHNEWTGTDPSETGSPTNFRVSWPETPFLVRGLKIDLDTSLSGSKWDEIDAVWVIGDLPADGCLVSVSPNEMSAANFENLDITPPVVVNTTVSRAAVADPLVGPAGFTIAVTYNKPMSSLSAPAIVFAPDAASTLTLAGDSWSGPTYTAAYDVADAGILLPHVGISISGARDAAGLLETPFSADNLFAIVTLNPTVTVAPLTTGSRTPTLTGMVASADPSIPIATVTVLVGGQSLAATVNGGVWSVPVENALPDGPYDVQATAIDPFGNRGIDATTGELTVDTVTPMVERISPSQGPSRGGASVTITGWNLGNALTVDFGAYPAASFTIDSDTQITAVSPAGRDVVDVTVATASSTSATSSADRFAFLSLDADGNGQAIGLSDGILILRYLFDFRGHSLVQGSLGAGATRTEPEQLVAFLAIARGTMLDIDGNARIEPMADGLLLLRYLFDFRGAALVKGVLGQNATRTDPQQIVAFLDTFLPPGSSKGAAEPKSANAIRDAAPAETHGPCAARCALRPRLSEWGIADWQDPDGNPRQRHVVGMPRRD
jgi:hypothetical protein